MINSQNINEWIQSNNRIKDPNYQQPQEIMHLIAFPGQSKSTKQSSQSNQIKKLLGGRGLGGEVFSKKTTHNKAHT